MTWSSAARGGGRDGVARRLPAALALAALVACGQGQADSNTSGGASRAVVDAGAQVDTSLCVARGAGGDGDRENRASLDAFVRDRMARQHREGLAASVVEDGAVIWRSAYGIADREAAIATTPDTVFPVASMSKPVLAAAVMQVVEEVARRRRTEIDAVLDDDVDSLVRSDPEDTLHVRHPAFPAERVTLRMILAHVSGIQNRYELVPHSVPVLAPDFGFGAIPELRQTMTQYLHPGGDFFHASNFVAGAPGTRHEYSSVAASIAALVVEAQTGIPFGDYCRDHLFVPLAMHDTAWRLRDLPAPRSGARTLAMPYEWVPGPGGAFVNRRADPPLREHVFYPAASLRSTAGDYGRFVGMLMSGGTVDGVQYLARSTVDEMLRVQFPTLDAGQGLLLYRLTLDGAELAAHNGANVGYRSEMAFALPPPEGQDAAPRAKRFGVVVLTNGDDSALQGSDVVRSVEAELLRRAAKGCLGASSITP